MSNPTPEIDVYDQSNKLARLHHEYSEGMQHAFMGIRKFDSDAKIIKLLYVDELVPPSGCVPLYFPPHPSSGILLPSEIISLTPSEYNQLNQEMIKLPEGWELGEEIEFNVSDGNCTPSKTPGT